MKRSKTWKSGMFHNVDLLLVSCFFLTVESQTGNVLQPPQNLLITWINEFNLHLSWAPLPQYSMRDCSYTAELKTTEDLRSKGPMKTNTWTTQVVMNGGFLKFSVTVECNGTVSEPAVINVTYPELVKNWTCYYSRKLCHCFWEPASDASNVSFRYRLEYEGLQRDDSGPSPIQECPSYKYIKDKKMSHGCDLEADYHNRIYIIFTDKRNNTVLKNTFQIPLWKHERPPPLNWTVRNTENKFNIVWSQPDIDSNGEDWKYLIMYTECKETKTLEVDGSSYLLDRVPHCPYRMTIKAKHKDHEESETPWSEEKKFGADSNQNMLEYAAFIVPLMFAGLAVLTFVCCSRNKENIFPKVPQPRDLLSDISDNNNKRAVCNLYIPAKEEENCNITLVIDPQVNKPDCCDLQPLSGTMQGSQITR